MRGAGTRAVGPLMDWSATRRRASYLFDWRIQQNYKYLLSVILTLYAKIQTNPSESLPLSANKYWQCKSEHWEKNTTKVRVYQVISCTKFSLITRAASWSAQQNSISCSFASLCVTKLDPLLYYNGISILAFIALYSEGLSNPFPSVPRLSIWWKFHLRDE